MCVVCEGGHRVIGLANWPTVIQAGQVSGALVSSLDYMPTMAELADVTLPSDRHFDGISLVTLINDTEALKRNDSGHTSLFHPLSGAGQCVVDFSRIEMMLMESVFPPQLSVCSICLRNAVCCVADRRKWRAGWCEDG